MRYYIKKIPDGKIVCWSGDCGNDDRYYIVPASCVENIFRGTHKPGNIIGEYIPDQYIKYFEKFK
jgi:hypothetical protein